MVSGTRDNSTRSCRGEKFFHSIVYNILLSVYMRWVRQLVVGRCLASTGRVTWAGETTFSHVNRSDHSPGMRQQNLIACACETRVFLLYICSLIFLRKKGKILGLIDITRVRFEKFFRPNLRYSQRTLSILIKWLFIQSTNN